ncbi:Four-jointed box protein 1 [Chionoecetes opilio]|uniref:Four-jointed box protein 1 n=1 Tax=Chionoecetes opilio TaxID=41210 RepID=A0A8J4YJ47_CHIOP|nr:Four-jointed box protein 1 [Chionoecetes opilio]
MNAFRQPQPAHHEPPLAPCPTSPMLTAAQYYPMRPAVWRGWDRHHHPPSRCYLPKSWPVYRLQRLVTLAVCLLAVLLMCLVAFTLLQAAPASPRIRFGRVRTLEDEEQPLSGPGHREDDYNSESALDDYDDEEDEEELVMSEDYEDTGRDHEYNPEFDMSYFDFSIKGKAVGAGGAGGRLDEGAGTFKTPVIRASWTQLPLPPVHLMNRGGVEVVRDGILFSGEVEAKLKDPGMSDEEVGRLLWQVRSRQVVELRDPSWDRCGRPKNQWVKFTGGVAACARYSYFIVRCLVRQVEEGQLTKHYPPHRYPDDHLLLGEVLSFYLARLLRVERVLPATLARPDHPRWAAAAPQMEHAGWGAAPVVVLTPWLPDLVRDHMPAALLHALTTNTTLGVAAEVEGNTRPSSLREASEGELVRLLQWSDLLLFDYLTANYDRVAYMLDATEGEGRPEVLAGTVHNLVRNRDTGALWLLDNESGLVDGYSLLYNGGDPAQASRFSAFHRHLLQSMCVIPETHRRGSPGPSRAPKAP